MQGLIEKNVIVSSIERSGMKYYMMISALMLVVLWGAYAYYIQLRDGLVVTGMRNYYSWGLYITNFVFFIGISHAGTLISGILRVTGAEWRKPITRMAEAITVLALLVGAPMVLIDLGRPDRMLNLFKYGRIQSPILWDVFCVFTYIVGSITYLYVPMIPDLAMLRDKYKNSFGIKAKIYKFFSLGWQGTDAQKKRLHRCIKIMAVLIIPIAVSVHTVVSWIFGMTLRPGWHSSIFGPYFVIGAIFSGIAGIITAMALFRKFYHLEKYITPLHFRNLGILMLTLNLVYIYFTVSEYLTIGYTAETADARLLDILFKGDFALAFWGCIISGLFLPALLTVFSMLKVKPEREAVPRRILRPSLAFAIGLLAVIGIYFYRPLIFSSVGENISVSLPWILAVMLIPIFISFIPELRRRPILCITIASILINIGMWLKRYIIVLPAFANPFLSIQGVPTEWAHYNPTWVEWSITGGAFAAFVLLYMMFSKLFPIVSIWETSDEK